MSGKEGTGRSHPEEQEQRDHDARSGYLGFVAHEVRNPLSTALWSAELLSRMGAEERGGPRGEKLTAMCLRSLSRVRQLIEDHFLAERLDVGGIVVRPEPLGLAEVVEEAIGRRPSDIGPITVVADPGVTLHADRMLLDRALDGLLAAAGREGTPVRVVLRAERGQVSLSIQGGPIAPDAFVDPRKGSPSDLKGRALTLPVVRRAALALGGRLAVEGESFVLTLPLEPAYTPRPDASAHP
jgi:signal transduction histidine kinase